MYKKITHTITEEHFDHPMAVDIKKNVDSKKSPKSKGWYLINDNMSHGLDQFEKNNIHAWSGLAWVMGDLINSIVDGTPDQDDLVKHFGMIVNKISMLIAPIATDSQITQFNTLLTAWGAAAIAVITDTAAGKDTTADMTTLTASIADLANFLNSLETMWDAAMLTTILTAISTDYVAKATARMNKDWPGATDAGGHAYKLLLIGQDDGGPALADIFAAGIIV
jgi:hypothetical protein